MAHDLKLSATLANAMVNAVNAVINGGSVKHYTLGSGVPASCSVAITDQVLLSTNPLNATALASASSGIAAFNAITQDASIDATGTAAFFRVLDSGGTCHIQGLCDTSSSDSNLSTLSFVAGSTMDITTSGASTLSLG